ncbi:MAG: twin-arginine translocation signal domain-containing protein, partial [Anaerolineales bacterium]|nr:twin-arginine translocation signal domain-containing protein [Anaerolineales bacterium]
MKLTRRNFLRLGGATAVAAGTTGCSVIGREVAQDELPESLAVPTAVPDSAPLTQTAPELPSLAVNPARRLLNRA